MHLFEYTTLFYLSFHALAFVLLFVSVMGIPGQPDETKTHIKLLLKIWNVLLLIAWKGLYALAIAGVAAFFFHYDTIGKILSCISLGIGLALFITVVAYYSSQTK